MNEHRPSPIGRPDSRVSSWRARLPLAFIIGSGLSLSCLLFFIVREAETKRLHADFERRATIPVTAILSAIEEHVALLRSIAAFYFSSHQVDRNEFAAFTQDGLLRSPAIQAIAWAPRVIAGNRVAHESAVRSEGYPQYEIGQIDTLGNRQRAGERPVFFPVMFVAPEPPNRTMLGFDLASDSLLLQAMDASLSLGSPVSSRLTISQTDGRRDRYYRIVVPVYQSGALHETLADRQGNLGGYAMAVVRPSVLIGTALDKIPGSQVRSMAVQVMDVGTSRDAIFASDNWQDEEPGNDLDAISVVKLAGRTWQIVCKPAPGMASEPMWQSWAVLFTGLVLTGLVAGYLSAMWDRAAKVERQVEERTAELAQSNATLQQESDARKIIADALAQERYLVDSLMDTVPDHIYFKDTRSRFLRINKSMANLFHLQSPDEAVGKTDFDFFTPEHAQRAFDDEQQIIRTGESLIGREEKETWPDGRVTWVSSTKEALRDRNGKIVGTFGISRDITERKRTEDALAEKARELQRSNTELEQFAYVASHDLQEPLRMVASYTQLLGRRYRAKLDKEADEFIGYAVEGATRMQVLINDLLAYSRVGTRGKPFAPTPCGDVLARTLANLKLAIEETGATVEAPPTLPVVMADSSQLTQLFQNLISNALKFRAPGRQPRVRINVNPHVTPPDVRVWNAEWLFAVRDNGIGIDPKYFERIFVLFQRLHTREQYPGTGIGLAVCKKIVERHGGRIWVESTPGEGSTFYFTLPKVNEADDT
jgi:PAS domain S-box-containing protein